MPNDPEDRAAEAPAPPDRGESRAEELFDDIFGVDFKVPRTIAHTILRPRRVAEAAWAHDRGSYTRPLRIFLALFAIQTVLMGWSGFSELNTISTLVADDPAAAAAVSERLAGQGATIADADAAMTKWVGWANWPMTIAASLVYVLVIWMLRPSFGFYRSFMAYVVATNASSILTLPFFAVAVFTDPMVMIAGFTVTLISFFAYMAVILYRHLGLTWVGFALRMLVVAPATLLVTALVSVFLWLWIDAALRVEIGVSVFELMRLATEA